MIALNIATKPLTIADTVECQSIFHAEIVYEICNLQTAPMPLIIAMKNAPIASTTVLKHDATAPMIEEFLKKAAVR